MACVTHAPTDSRFTAARRPRIAHARFSAGMFFRFQRLRCESSQWTSSADLAFIDYEELPANVSAAYDDLLCSVMSTSQRFGDYQDDTVSQMSDAINREYWSVWPECFVLAEPHWNAIYPNPSEALSLGIGARQNGQHTWHMTRLLDVEFADACVRMRGSHHYSVRASNRRQVGYVACPAGEEFPVFRSPDGLTYPKLIHGQRTPVNV